MRTPDHRSGWGRPRPTTIRLIARCDRVSLQVALGDPDATSPASWPLDHGRLRDHLVVELPAWSEAEDLAVVLARLERRLPVPVVAVADLGGRWLVIEARAAHEPTSRTVASVDAVLVASGIPAGAATIPMRELDDPGVVLATVETAERHRPLAGA